MKASGLTVLFELRMWLEKMMKRASNSSRQTGGTLDGSSMAKGLERAESTHQERSKKRSAFRIAYWIQKVPHSADNRSGPRLRTAFAAATCATQASIDHRAPLRSTDAESPAAKN